jgi:TetR/AcrR family transcriptional repressor of mexJK operon
MQSPSGIYLRKNAQRKYDAILKSACRLFLKNGYTRTSMDAIAIDAKVSKQTVYSYFTNKDILFCQMIELECARHNPDESVLEHPSVKPQDALYMIGRGFLDMINTPRSVAIHRLVVAEAERHHRIARLYFDSGPLRLQRVLENYIAKQAAAGVFVTRDVEHSACCFMAMVKGPLYLRLTLRIRPLPTRKDMDDHIRGAIRDFYKLFGK